MTFDLYLSNRMKLAATAGKPDKIDARLLVLHPLTKRDEAQQREYEGLLKATRARFKASELERKAKASLEQKEESERKADTHSKILIGIAAIEMARHDMVLAASLSQRACGMSSARTDLIQQLLGLEVAK